MNDSHKNQLVKELADKREEMKRATFMRVIFDINQREAFKALIKAIASMTLLRHLILLHRLHHQHYSFGLIASDHDAEPTLNEHHNGGLTDKDLDEVSYLLMTSEHLESLDISFGEQLSDDAIKRFINSLSENKSLQSLRIRDRALPIHHLPAFREACQCHPKLKHVDMCMDELHHPEHGGIYHLVGDDSLTSLHIRYDGHITDKHKQQLHEALEKNTRLTHFKISHRHNDCCRAEIEDVIKPHIERNRALVAKSGPQPKHDRQPQVQDKLDLSLIPSLNKNDQFAPK